MTAKDLLQQTLMSSQRVLEIVLDGLSDQDLLVRAVPNANHIAWQLGHLIMSEHRFLCTLGSQSPPALPEGFADRHRAAASHEDSTVGYLRKDEYLDLYKKTRQATLAALQQLPETELNRPNTGPTAPIAPTLGALFALMGSHSLMHTGQFSVVRRTLGKPNAF
jgi:hypothetical protein